MKIIFDEALLSCAELAELAHSMMIGLDPDGKERDRKLDRITAILAVLTLTLDELTERATEQQIDEK